MINNGRLSFTDVAMPNRRMLYNMSMTTVHAGIICIVLLLDTFGPLLFGIGVFLFFVGVSAFMSVCVQDFWNFWMYVSEIWYACRYS